jgi:hypothetical protein
MTSTIGEMYNKGVSPQDALNASQKIVEEAAKEYLNK